ncbi:type IV pilus secretin PilQ [Desulfonatronum thiosulfatophilum]|uniref:type IV pilus secretin PilQ n=1 Tax=Desulfonatronum thiosulfatophilum TaxID=617002 RepID=UPI00137B0FC2|nr:type IV pilus secretin PilQ [Desulfonatronum thiosulfatophilum]
MPDSDSLPRTLAPVAEPPRNQLGRVIFFQDDDATIGVNLETSWKPTWELAPARPGQIRIVFPNLVSPPALTKLHQLHGYAHPVKSALLRNTMEGLEVLLTATSPVIIESEAFPGRVMLRFVDETKPEPPARGPAPTVSSPRGIQRDALQRDTAAMPTVLEETLFPGMRDEYFGEPISIDLQNAEVEHVLRLIGEVAGYNLILDAGVGGRISMKLNNVPWDQVLDLVLLQRNLGMVVRGNILRISTAQQLESEREQVRRVREAAMQAEETIQRLEPLQTAYIQVNYATAAEMDVRTRPFLSERGRLSSDPRTNTLIVTDSPSRIREIQGSVDRLDRAERQVLIEARVVYATEDFQRGMGIQWGGGIETVSTRYHRGLYGGAGSLPPPPGAGVAQSGYLVNTPLAMAPTFGIGGFISKLMGPDMFTLDAQLQLAELQNIARTVSSPRVVTLNNQRAQIEQGTRIAIQVTDERGTRTDYVDAVLMLSVIPQITPNNNLILDLEIRDDNPVGSDIDTKTTRTRLMVEDGQTLVLGGVLKSTEDRLENRVPGFADIPGLGWLFKSRSERSRNQELLIFIRPSIL